MPLHGALKHTKTEMVLTQPSAADEYKNDPRNPNARKVGEDKH